MNRNSYHRQWKENAENLYVTEKPMETTVTPTKRKPFAAFTPNTQSQFQTAKPTCTVGTCIKPWHEGECSGRMTPSKRPRQSDGICSTKSKKRLRRLWTQDFISIDGWTSYTSPHTGAEVKDSLMHQSSLLLLWRDRLCIHRTTLKTRNSDPVCSQLYCYSIIMLWKFYTHYLWGEHECSLVSSSQYITDGASLTTNQ